MNSYSENDGSNNERFEFVTPVGYSNSSKCGYCGDRSETGKNRYSYYAKASSISPKFYQLLLDRYWRRSGKLLYRPNQRRSCCPHYSIRLDSSEFKPSRTQRHTVNRFNKHVLGDKYIKEAARLCPRTKEETKRRDNEFVLAERIHEAEFDRLKATLEPAHKLVVTLEEDTFTEEKYQVYNNYQAAVHHDDPEDRCRESFTRFLCDSPIRRQTMKGSDGKQRLLGSYHQCYRLDGKLVAMGVLDLLPNCVSSVYFIYDESIHNFVPGKLGALVEISLAQEQSYRWWYPGFYIHTCPKMRYKIDYSPQYILDPQSLRWNLLDDKIMRLLDQKAFVSLCLEEAANKEDQSQKTSSTAFDTSRGVYAETVFNADMPGIVPLSVLQRICLNKIALKPSGYQKLWDSSFLVGWVTTSDYTKWTRVKVGVAELISVMGIDCVKLVCIDLS